MYNRLFLLDTFVRELAFVACNGKVAKWKRKRMNEKRKKKKNIDIFNVYINLIMTSSKYRKNFSHRSFRNNSKKINASETELFPTDNNISPAITKIQRMHLNAMHLLIAIIKSSFSSLKFHLEGSTPRSRFPQLGRTCSPNIHPIDLIAIKIIHGSDDAGQS